MGKNYCSLEKRWCSYKSSYGCTWLCGKCKSAKQIPEISSLKTCPKRQYYRTESLKELIDATPFNDVWGAISNWFPDQKQNKNGYEEAYYILREMKPKKYVDAYNFYIVVKKEWEQVAFDDARHYLDASLRKRGTNDISYSFEFMPWENVLYLNIDPIIYNVNRELSVPEIIAGILYEMTFFGYSPEKIEENTSWTKKM